MNYGHRTLAPRVDLGSVRAPRDRLAGARRLLKLGRAAHAVKHGRAQSIAPDMLAATTLLGATLGTVPGLIDQLLDGPQTVVILEAPDDVWADIMAKSARACFRNTAGTKNTANADENSTSGSTREVYVYTAGKLRPNVDRDSLAASTIAEMQSVIGIAASPRKELEEVVLRAAEHHLACIPLDATLLALVVAAVTGSRPTKCVPAESLRQIDLIDLRLALHPGRGPDGCIERLEHLLKSRARPAAGRPRLRELPGYGTAGEWGMALAQDLKAFARFELPATELAKGAVLWGPPGVGKTLLAAAIAGEAGVPLLVGSLGRWQSVGEAHLGTTCKAMRQFFSDARNQAPCIAFVDELDSFGDRASFTNRNRSYDTQIINTFLECLDGAEHRDGVVLLGATNNPNQIDPAITRSGRFDRLIEITLPSKDDIAAIIRYHLGNDMSGVDLDEVARFSIGKTGADCAALVRRARSRARRRARPIEIEDLFAEIDVANPPPNPELLHRIAVHESGHAIVAHELRTAVGDVGIGSAPTGGSGFAYVGWLDIATRETCRTALVVAMAGRAAETVLLGSPSAGSAGDLAEATELATRMHTRWGLGPWLSVSGPNSSPGQLGGLVEMEIRHALERATAIVEEKRGRLELLARTVLERRTLTGTEVVEILDAPSPGVPRPPAKGASPETASSMEMDDDPSS